MIYVLEIAYKGTNYHGWQIQKNAHTVQEELNNAISTLIAEPVDSLASGRTDTGVHAEQQFVQFETIVKIEPEKFLFQINSILPREIFVKHIYYAATHFSVRHNATKRSYEYRISRHKNPFLNDLYCFYYQRDLNVGLMSKAAKILARHSDFQSFSKYKTAVDHFECTIYEAYWENKNGLLIFHITANRFLRGMVRAIVGTLLEVGTGKIDIDKFEQIILAKDRKAAKHAAPPEGLFLTKIKYPKSMLKLLA